MEEKRDASSVGASLGVVESLGTWRRYDAADTQEPFRTLRRFW